ncbi:MAG: hypothetical protein KF754_02405 [Planctomycetes bacterium]|nr:hypothetical protein [Planctomycetota bacterium]
MRRILPALLACTVLALLPACGSTQRFEAMPATVEVIEPSGAGFVAPAATMYVPRITRQAGEFCPPKLGCEDELWSYLVLFVVYGLIYLGYGVVYLFSEMIESAKSSSNECVPEEEAQRDAWMP